MSAFDSLSADVREAWAGSFLSALPRHSAELLLRGAVPADVARGEIVYRAPAHEQMATVALVVDGLLRVYLRSPEGRQVTLRYLSAPDILGMPAVVLGRTAPGDVQALTDCRLLRLDTRQFRTLAQKDPAVAWTVAVEFARRFSDGLELLAENVFLSVRGRVARHLLDLAVREQHLLVVRASQQEVADAIGSVREVVSRALKGLRDEHLIDRGDNAIVLADPAGLHRASREHGARVIPLARATG
jgi:CRP/FNR family transcriptional regulator